MRISTKLKIIYITSVGIIIIAGAFMYASSKQLTAASINLKYVDTIMKSVFELNIVADEYLLHYEKRPHIQWEITVKKFSRHLGEKKFNDPNNQSLLIKIREDLGIVMAHFSDLVARHQASRNNLESQSSRQMQNRLQSLLQLRLQRMLSHSNQLKNQIEGTLFSIQRFSNLISIVMIVCLVLFLIIVGFFIGRDIMSPIKKLVKGTEIVSSGNILFRFETDKDDEMGSLADAFDRMINSLKALMVSRDELEQRVKERTLELKNMNKQLEREIEERKEKVKDVKLAKVKYRTVADYTYDWEYWLDKDGNLAYVSPSCERISGYPAQTFIDSPQFLRDIIVEEDRQIWNDHAREFQRGLKSHEIEFRIRRQDGEIRWIEHVSQPVFDDQGKPSGSRASNRDATSRKISELEVERLKDKLAAESAYLQDEIKLEHNFENIIGRSEGLKYVLHQVQQVAATDASVLILGETGTGKELVARAVHRLSPVGDRLLVKVNCAAIPEGLFESELFGHEKGAFTGAVGKRIGRFELASGSTLFLDEIGEMPLALQAKLLRVLEGGEFERLGSAKTVHSTARIIASTNRNLEDEVRKGRFREDLLFRLKVFTISVPPLRKRTDDIPSLTRWFMGELSKKTGTPAPEISKHTMQTMQEYRWPGNVRELKHTIESGLITSGGKKLQVELPKTSGKTIGGFKPFKEMEREYLLQVLEAKNWKIGGADSAASALEMHVNTLRARMKKLGIKKPNNA
jgi:PAS domain S-box-containing protein